jgi:mRNA interferase RelE/StbE
MSYIVIVPKSVQKQIDRLPKYISDKILKEITKLEINPHPVGCKKLEGREAWRIRIGNYRVIYEINDKGKIVTLFRVRHRSNIYR